MGVCKASGGGGLSLAGLEGNGILCLLGVGVLDWKVINLGKVGEVGALGLRGDGILGVLGKRIPGLGYGMLFGVLGARTLAVVCGGYMRI